jgi:hypothetical protein
MNKIMATQTFIRYAKQSSMICIPIKTGGNGFNFVKVDKDSFLEELSTNTNIDAIYFDQIRDAPESTIWLHTPSYPEVEMP